MWYILQSELHELDGESPDEDQAEPASAQSLPGGSSAGIVSLLEDRLQNYRDAADAAKTAGDTSKQRRADRGVKVLLYLLCEKIFFFSSCLKDTAYF